MSGSRSYSSEDNISSEDEDDIKLTTPKHKID